MATDRPRQTLDASAAVRPLGTNWVPVWQGWLLQAGLACADPNGGDAVGQLSPLLLVATPPAGGHRREWDRDLLSRAGTPFI